MKLKYYMRGLGIGIILTTLIITLSGGFKDKISDQEIKDRALKLGMVMKEDNLDDVLGDIKPTGSPLASPTTTPAPEVTKAPTTAPSPTLSPTPKVTTKPVPTNKPAQTSDSQPGNVIAITVEKGMSSGKVAKRLYENGLIDDADKFNNYIVKQGKADVIRVGTFKIPQGASYSEILTILTSR